MTVIFKPVALGAAWTQRQNRVEPVQRLNGTLLVDAKHCGVLRRIEVKTNNIGSFRFEIRIVARHVTLQPMRFYLSFPPHPVNQVLADAKRLRQFAATPMCRSVRRRLARAFNTLARNCGINRYGFCPG
jgi:hypothetical protein